MAETQQGPPAVAVAKDSGCPVSMMGGKRCGRPTWGPTINGIAYCLMHIPSGQNAAEFQVEIERILSTAGNGTADFTRFVFPRANYRHKQFQPECVFVGAEFHNRTEFNGATFQRGADFQSASFRSTADFAAATFSQGG